MEQISSQIYPMVDGSSASPETPSMAAEVHCTGAPTIVPGVVQCFGQHPRKRSRRGLPVYILRSLRSLKGVLADMDREQRRVALSSLSPLVRMELLGFMEQA